MRIKVHKINQKRRFEVAFFDCYTFCEVSRAGLFCYDLELHLPICEEKVKKRCFTGEKRLIFSTVYKKFIKNLMKTLDKDPEKGYIISVG